MAGRIGTVARAFELARSGRCESIQELEKTLIREDYEDVLAHLSGPFIRTQLREAIAKAEPRPELRQTA